MSGYIGVEPIPKVTQILTEGTLASPSQTINVPGGYTVGNIAVYINGFRLKNGTFSAPDGMVVNLLEEFPAGTEYIIEEFRQFEVADLPAGGATGGGNDRIFYNNRQIVTTNYTIPVGENSHSVGPIEILNGVTVEVPDGSRWVIS